jgi:hypothetical protein
MDLLYYWAQLLKIFRRRGLIKEVNLLKVLVDVLLRVLGSSTSRHNRALKNYTATMSNKAGP